MTKLGLAFRAFFRILGDATVAAGVEEILAGAESAPALPDPARAAAPRRADSGSPPQPPRGRSRSPALTLLATLQREARFLDFLMEPLDDYPDDQVGAAARDVQRDCAAVVERIFAPQPLLADAEGSRVKVPAGFDPARYRLTGNVAGEPPFEGTLRHPGWKAASCEMPSWAGNDDAASVVAPSEVEV